MRIDLEHLWKRFHHVQAIENVSLSVPSGALVALIGPSGSGKTTLLRLIAGLESPDQGRILFDHQDYTSRHLRERNVGFVFQHYALFKHMTVYENIAFGLRVKPRRFRPSPEVMRKKVYAMLELVHMQDFVDFYPRQLSGGQRQRVALARSLVMEPSVLLLDEPFGALDAKVRKELRRWMRRLHDSVHLTSVFVTHDQEEALEVADAMVIMHDGKVEQTGTPMEIYHHPSNAFVYDFLGNFNAFEGWKDPHGGVHMVEYDAPPMRQPRPPEGHPLGWGARWPWAMHWWRKMCHRLPWYTATPSGQALAQSTLLGSVTKAASAGCSELPQDACPVSLFARPHDMELLIEQDGQESIMARITHIHAAGPLVHLELERRNGTTLQIDISHEQSALLGVTVGQWVYTRPRSTRVFEE